MLRTANRARSEELALPPLSAFSVPTRPRMPGLDHLTTNPGSGGTTWDLIRDARQFLVQPSESRRDMPVGDECLLTSPSQCEVDTTYVPYALCLGTRRLLPGDPQSVDGSDDSKEFQRNHRGQYANGLFV